jgi:hypothetical protein
MASSGIGNAKLPQPCERAGGHTDAEQGKREHDDRYLHSGGADLARMLVEIGRVERARKPIARVYAHRDQELLDGQIGGAIPEDDAQASGMIAI